MGLTLGPYVAPALASFRPPAALVGSTELTFWEEARRTTACDGPACSIPASTLYSVNSFGFEGIVTFTVVPTTPTAGWNVLIDKPSIPVHPGDQTFVRLVLDCYTDPMVGASPRVLKVRVTATAHPKGGGPAFTIGTHLASAESVRSTLDFTTQHQTLHTGTTHQVQTTEVLVAQWVDSSSFGPVQVHAVDVPSDWEVAIGEPLVSFGVNGSHSIPVRVRLPEGSAGTGRFRVLAVLDHPSFAAPMEASTAITVMR